MLSGVVLAKCQLTYTRKTRMSDMIRHVCLFIQKNVTSAGLEHDQLAYAVTQPGVVCIS